MTEETGLCLVCGKSIPAHRRTCSRRCAGLLNPVHINPDCSPRPCEHCSLIYTPLSLSSKYCTSSCQKRAQRARNIEYYRAVDKIKISRQRIGLNIRDVSLHTPSRDAKWLWDSVGRWCKNPDIDSCLECHSTVYKHLGNGLCERCYDKLRTRDPEKAAESKRASYEKKKAAGGQFSRKQAKLWIDRAKSKEIEVTPVIENLLDNLTNL